MRSAWRPPTSFLVVAGVVLGILPVTALLMLLTIPLAFRVSRGLGPNYENPYGLMAIMGVNVQVHLYAGMLLLPAYLVLVVAARSCRRSTCSSARPARQRRLTEPSQPMAIGVANGFARPRARLSGLDASTTLEHFALVTFDVDPDRLAASLPGGT